MSLTPSQLQSLKTDVETQIAPASGTAIEGLDPANPDDRYAIAAWYNENPAAAFYVFKTSVGTDEARSALDWTEVLDATNGLTALERWGFDTLLHNGDFNPTNEQTRDGFVAIFDGTNHPNTRAALLAVSVRLATRVEQLFAVAASGPGGGNGSAQGSAAALTFEGAISHNDIEQAFAT